MEVSESRTALSLLEFMGSAIQVCEKYHNKCKGEKCQTLVSAAMKVRERKVIALSELWRLVKDGQYKGFQARRLFLQAPLAIFTVGVNGRSASYVCEKSSKELYSAVIMVLMESQKYQ